MAVELEINRKRAQRLMRILGIEAHYAKPNLSRPAPGHEIYPYLLRGVAVERPNHVWSTDITYIPMRGGFLYLVAVMDWFSRYVLSWELSNTMETGFCLAALHAAFRFGQPEIWNSDQGSQFTSADFLAPLKKRGISISMDGRGRALDNVFIERLWRSLKYELIYPGDFATGQDLFQALENYFHFYNYQRPHQALTTRRRQILPAPIQKEEATVVMGAPPPSPRDLPLLFSRMDAFCFTRNGACRTIDLLARRIGLSRDGTRAPMQVRNGWRPSGRRSDQPAALSKNGRFFVQPMGSTSLNTAGLELKQIFETTKENVFRATGGQPISLHLWRHHRPVLFSRARDDSEQSASCCAALRLGYAGGNRLLEWHRENRSRPIASLS